jgi:hypothetical protein
LRRENAETYLSTSSRPSKARAGTHNHECLYCAMLQLQLYLHLASVVMLGWTAPDGIDVPE